ncbi:MULTISPECIES: TetR/AcrR family transcriptional regulator [unclassified Microbacterium]|uniref:TetR/AcrR family transcriptional regulator n=1 Tax=unclassified Microbacterium TaxID=2609290 RepID=UPI00301AB96C
MAPHGTGRTRKSVAERRADILEAATALISERGFRGTALRDIAAHAGITEAGILYHLGSKDGLLIAVLEHRDEVDMTSLAANLGIDVAALDADPLPVPLADLCRALVERNARQPEIVRLYATLEAESLDPDHPASAYFRRRESWALGIFERAAQTAGFTDPRRAALATLSLMDGLQLRWLRSENDLDLTSAWDQLAADIVSPAPREGSAL